MIDIFEKYNFSVDSFLNDQSSSLIIFSSWPKDFLKINSVKKRKNLFINTILPIIFIENRKIQHNELRSVIDEKHAELERLRVEYDSLVKVEQEQKTLIEKLSNNEA